MPANEKRRSTPPIKIHVSVFLARSRAYVLNFITPFLLLALCGLCRGEVIIAEFLADNVTGIKDENDTRQDWIKLYNSGPAAVSLAGWCLSDDASNKLKWEFPHISIGSGRTLLVWASGKDRRIPNLPLHTNFSLAKAGEYLGLHRPATSEFGRPLVVDEFAPSFPAQATDVSFGRSFTQKTIPLLASGAIARYRVLANSPTGQAQYSGASYDRGDVGTNLPDGWNVSASFPDGAWTIAATGIGYDTDGTFLRLVGSSPSGNCQTALRDVNTSILIRCPFTVADLAAFTNITLKMKYEDGFVAFVNGTQVAQANNPAALTYNSNAPVALDETIVNAWSEFTIPANLLRTGTNLLAIQGLNSSANSSDFIILPEIIGSTGVVIGDPVYFSSTTPTSLNGVGTAGPVMFNPLPADPAVPRPTGSGTSPPLSVSVKVLKTQHAITAVKAFYRIMFNAESAGIALLDNGVSPDATANDGVYSANLPTTAVGAAQMLRWRFEAVDAAGNLTKLPAFSDPLDSPKYFGTVARSPLATNSQLPVLEWFVEGAPSTGPTAATFRGSCYYLGYFYDNTGHEIHGQSTASLAKKSYDFDSNSGYHFLWQEGETRVKDLNLLSNIADKTKTRNSLSHEVGKRIGAPYHFCFPVRMHLNGDFHGVMDFMEDGDDRMLKRNGLDPEGALYKIYAETMNVSPEKKTRKTEPNTDLDTFTNSLDPAQPRTTRRTYGYDNINIAATINYLVLRQLNSDADHGHKNYYLYRDTNTTGEWLPIVWDVDLSQGHQWNGDNGTGGYFNDTLTAKNALNRHSGANRLYNLILESSEFQEMFARRMRTVMDSILQAPGTANGWFETRMRELAASLDPDPANPSPLTDGDLDHAKWGVNAAFIDNRPREEVERVVTGYFPARRTFLFDQSTTRPLVQKSGLTGGTPIPGAPQAVRPDAIVVDSLDYYPSPTSQAGEYLILRNTTANAIDLSGWRIRGGIDHSFTPGTVIPAGAATAAVEYKGLLHLVKNATAFRARTSGPKGGENRFIQGNYSGQLSARGETIQLFDATNALITTYRYVGNPSPAQSWLRVSEVHYHPAPPTPEESAALNGVTGEDFEFIELVNNGPTTIDLSGMSFTAGVNYAFPPNYLAPGARIVLAKRPGAFRLRHPDLIGVLGGYEGNLNNDGDRLELTEASGEVVLDFSFNDAWYPRSDGLGYSLVLRDPATAVTALSLASSWIASAARDGSPGQGDTFAPLTIPLARLSNLSVRTSLDAHQIVTVGFTLSGGSKSVLLRAVGPTLVDFGVPNFMADPKLDLFSGTNKVNSNDNWGGTNALAFAFQSVGAFGYASPSSRDAALVTTINGGQTLQVSGPTAGTVLVEGYDAVIGDLPRFTNLSARNQVGTGTNILIAGFTLWGSGKRDLLVRAVGPKLIDFGVTAVLLDPKLEIFSGTTKIAENDNWPASLAPAFASVGAFGLTPGSKDAAITVSLPAGSYTVQVSGADGGVGEAIVEIYELP